MTKQEQIENKKIINTILNQKENFTEKDILEALSKNEDDSNLIDIIKEKIEALCEINLVKDTLLYYYVR